jgi:hypothetical protein
MHLLLIRCVGEEGVYELTDDLLVKDKGLIEVRERREASAEVVAAEVK